MIKVCPRGALHFNHSNHSSDCGWQSFVSLPKCSVSVLYVDACPRLVLCDAHLVIWSNRDHMLHVFLWVPAVWSNSVCAIDWFCSVWLLLRIPKWPIAQKSILQVSFSPMWWWVEPAMVRWGEHQARSFWHWIYLPEMVGVTSAKMAI